MFTELLLLSVCRRGTIFKNIVTYFFLDFIRFYTPIKLFSAPAKRRYDLSRYVLFNDDKKKKKK